MRIPPKPKRGKRSPFYWWRRWKSHQYLPVRKGLLARIQNGDFEYSQLFDWANYEMKYKQDELDQFVKEYKGKDDPKTDELYRDIERRYQKRYNKLFEDAYEMENRHLEGLAEALSKKFKVNKKKIEKIMEGFGDSTEKLYLYVDKIKYTLYD
jgi:hypothetical protein